MYKLDPDFDVSLIRRITDNRKIISLLFHRYKFEISTYNNTIKFEKAYVILTENSIFIIGYSNGEIINFEYDKFDISIDYEENMLAPSKLFLKFKTGKYLEFSSNDISKQKLKDFKHNFETKGFDLNNNAIKLLESDNVKSKQGKSADVNSKNNFFRSLAIGGYFCAFLWLGFLNKDFKDIAVQFFTLIIISSIFLYLSVLKKDKNNTNRIESTPKENPELNELYQVKNDQNILHKNDYNSILNYDQLKTLIDKKTALLDDKEKIEYLDIDLHNFKNELKKTEGLLKSNIEEVSDNILKAKKEQLYRSVVEKESKKINDIKDLLRDNIITEEDYNNSIEKIVNEEFEKICNSNKVKLEGIKEYGKHSNFKLGNFTLVEVLSPVLIVVNTNRKKNVVLSIYDV